MGNAFLKWVRFKLERVLLRGASWRLLFIVCVIGGVCIAGGTAAFHVTGGQFPSWGDAVWWAFLRLTDPGYLGDDQGAALRTVSTVVTVLGYVLFMGSLIAIMVQWLDATVRRLEQGHTPVSIRRHVLILGWTNRTPIIVRELLLSEGRVQRFLERHNLHRLTIVILTEQMDVAVRQDLRTYLGPLWRERQIIFRSGSPLRREHLERAAFADASSIIVPGADFAVRGVDLADAGTLKVVMGLNREERERLPYLSAEVGDVRRKHVVREAYSGPMEVIASDSIVSQMLAQIIHHPGLARVYGELLTSDGECNVYVRSCESLEGVLLQDMGACFGSAVVVGKVGAGPGGYVPVLNAQAGTRLEPGEKLVFVARRYEDTSPSAPPKPLHRSVPGSTETGFQSKRILLMGWNDRIPLLLKEFSTYERERFKVDILSAFSVEDRERKIERHGPVGENVILKHIQGDYSVPDDLAALDLDRYHCILVLGCDWLPDKDEADARSILGCRVLNGLLGRGSELKTGPRVVLELLEPDNRLLLEQWEEVFLSPLILGHIQAHVALRPELNSVLHELFCSGGPSLVFRPASDYGLGGGLTTFGGVSEAVTMAGDTALGVRMDTEGGRELVIAPGRDTQLDVGQEDELLVLNTGS